MRLLCKKEDPVPHVSFLRGIGRNKEDIASHLINNLPDYYTKPDPKKIEYIGGSLSYFILEKKIHRFDEIYEWRERRGSKLRVGELLFKFNSVEDILTCLPLSDDIKKAILIQFS